MNKLDMESKDIVKDNLEYIKERFPEAVTEENGELRINPDSLIQSLSSVVIDDKKEKYELTWPGKRQSIVEGNTRTTKTLRPLKDKSVDFDKTENIYIEGDNLEALKILQESYLNKIKFIYIDPPYNTGNDFIYNDNFAKSTKEELIESGQIDELGNRLVTNGLSNGRFHSDWLTMMYPRLKLSRNLLTKDGLIFISIDDNEYDNLKKLCNEIFGENNYVATFNWMKTATPPSLSKSVRKKFEYVLCYSKTSNYNALNGGIVEGGDMPLLNEINKYATLIFPKDSLELKISDGIYKAGKYDRTCIEEDFKVENGKALNDLVLSGNFKWSQSTLNEEVNNGTKFWIKTDKFAVRYERIGERIKLPSNIISKEECGVLTNEEAQKEIKELFGERIMDYPKPTSLLKYLINMCSSSGDIILDFFSGSATTADACLQLNAEDCGNRKFILIQIPEQFTDETLAKKEGFNNMCEIGEERIKRAAKKIKESTKADIDYGFRVYKIDDSNMKDEFYMTPDRISQEQIKLFEDNIKEDRTPDDLITQVLLDLGLKLDLPIEEKNICGNKVFDVDDGELLACFDSNVSIDIIEEIAKINPRQVVFRDSSFATDQDKVNFEERLKRLSAGTKFNVL